MLGIQRKSISVKKNVNREQIVEDLMGKCDKIGSTDQTSGSGRPRFSRTKTVRKN